MLLAAATVAATLPAQACTVQAPPPSPFEQRYVSISNDSQFATHWAVSAGTGSASDPYVIQDIDFQVAGASAITIVSTHAHFVIRNVTVTDRAANVSDYGSCCRAGIDLRSLSNGSVVGSVVKGTQKGISSWYTENTSLIGNRIDGSPVGLEVQGSRYLTLRGNEVTGGGLTFETDVPATASTHTISDDNTFDGAPVLYRAHCSGATAGASTFSYAIFAQCSGAAMAGTTLQGPNGGLFLVYSDSTTVSGASIPALWARHVDGLSVDSSVLGTAVFEGFEDVSVAGSRTAPGASTSIEAANGTGFLLEDNEFEGGRAPIVTLGGTGFPYDCGCYPNPPDPAVGGPRIVNNSFRNGTSAIQLRAAPDAEVRGNSINGSVEGVAVRGDEGATIVGNTMVGPSGASTAVAAGAGNVRVSGNTLSGWAVGIDAGAGQGTEVSDNTVQAYSAGLSLSLNGGTAVSDNAFEGSGIAVDLNAVTGKTFQLGPGNTVNGLPIVVETNCSGIGHDGEALGQLIIYDCRGVTLSNLSFSDSSRPIQLGLVGDFSLDNISMTQVAAGLVLNSAWNGTVSNLTIDGGVSVYGSMGVDMFGTWNVTVEGSRVSNTNTGFSLRYSDAVMLEGNTVSNATEAGLSLDHAWEVLMKGNDFTGRGISLGGVIAEEWTTHLIDDTNTLNGLPILYYSGQDAVDIRGAEVGQLIVVNTAVVRITDSLADDRSGGVTVAFANELIIENLTMDRPNSWYGLTLNDVDFIEIRNSTLSGEPAADAYSEVMLYAVDFRSLVAANVQVTSDVGFAAFMGPGANLSVEGSRFRGNWSAMSAFEVVGATITDSTFEGGAHFQDAQVVEVRASTFVDGGLDLSSVNGAVVEGNRVSGAETGGLRLYNAWDVSVRNNTVTGSRYGAFVVGSSGNVSVEQNSFSLNGYGLMLNNAVYGPVNITENTVLENGVGILGNGSATTSVFHNFFLNNTIQARVGPEGAFDGGYILGGNYWSDYSGPDLCGGPAQDDCTGPDGYGDEALCLPGFGAPEVGADNYPLVNRTIPPPKDPPPPPGDAGPGGSGASFDAGVSLLGTVALIILAGLGAALWLSTRRPNDPDEGLEPPREP